MLTEKRSITVVWKNVRKIRSREKACEIMDWIERSNCDICAVNETGYAWYAANRAWTKGRSDGVCIIIK